MTYGSTRMFGNKFNSARNYAYGVGNPYGYGIEATMDFQNAYMDGAGFTTKDNLTSDTSALMRASKSHGLELSDIAYAASSQVQTGVLKSGEQYKFADLLATTIKDVGMEGRESEQLDVLESINEVLSRTLVTITEDGQNNAIALYSLLAKSNENLKGARGANLASSVNDTITSADNIMMLALGYGESYTGLEGRAQLLRQAEKGIADPENLKALFELFEKQFGTSINSEKGSLWLHDYFGISMAEADELVKNRGSILSGNYSKDLQSKIGSDMGESYQGDLMTNYNNSKVSTQEQYTNAKENVQATAGDFWNSTTSPFKSWFTGLTPGTQTALTLGGKVAGGAAAGVGGKWAVNKGIDWFKKYKGNGTTSAADDVAGAADDIAKGLDDVASAATNSADDVAKAAGKFGSAAGKIGKFGKAAGWLAIGLETVSTAVDTKDALDRGDGRTAATEVGEGLGTIGGGLAGAKLGAAIGSFGGPVGVAVGGIIGGIAGGIAGGWAGSAAGGGIHDLASGKDDLSESQLIQLKTHYDTVSNLYKKEGNNAAQRYTLQTVVPFLHSIGVSTSITDKYKTDTGKPDFMKDYEDGRFKLGIDYIPRDKFIAELHQGEAVLTADEAKKWRMRNSLENINNSISVPQSSGTSYNGTNLLEIRLSGAVDGMTQENQHVLVQAIVQQLGLSKNSVLGNLGNSFVRVPN